MKSEELIDEYEKQSGKKAIVDEKETVGFKRWNQQQESNPKLDDAISTFRATFRKDINDIIEIYQKKANINPSQKSILKYLKKYVKSVFPSKVTYKSRSFKIHSNGILNLKGLGIKDLRNVKGLFKLRFLKSLSFGDNEITKIPKEIGNLINLEELYLWMNDISTIPKEIGNLTKLKELRLDNNNISTIPKEIGNLTNLKILDMDDNNISTIPKEIGNLTNLEKIRMMRNNISEISKEIGNLKNLWSLALTDNNITTIPKEIGNLTSLRFLYMMRNNISEIPKEIGNLKNLKDFHINDNNITKNDIPSSLLNNKDIDVKF